MADMGQWVGGQSVGLHNGVGKGAAPFQHANGKDGETSITGNVSQIAREVSLAHPIGKMFFNILATFAEFEADLLRMRTREGMAIARAKGKLRGKQPKLSEKQLTRMHASGDYYLSPSGHV